MAHFPYATRVTAGIPVGIVVPEGNSLKFIAVKFHVYDLDGQHFATTLDVLRAIHKLTSKSSDNAYSITCLVIAITC